jgi:lipopolysaccharide/colanic/teichoic acid biosynthesis glycosyltransferase
MYYVGGQGVEIDIERDVTLEYAIIDRSRPAPSVRAIMGRRVSDATIRALDVLFSLTAIVFFFPVLLMVGLMVRGQDGGPVFFGQTRIGLGGRNFTCYKFRSMLVDAQARLKHLLATDASARAEWARDHKLKNDPRITGFGRFIRKTSLDEFPQLWNVLRGDMSLVGPRPIVQDEVHRYGRTFLRYAAVRPGITGLWQVSGRNNVSYSRRVALDRLFCRRRSVGLYLYIVFATVPVMLFQRGSY